ncbi:hypothetical protein LNKW23_31660 [Paralimibaculum aggregatum]|uniref:Uncharacterized protein n=1 Tax=Paralimibaculum aggregatum TaxID=3036245 RepID=A0ABQ6LLV4_9RHOB|nr:hypothetical protein [Limibaculum sp. NKW23]GMG83952.1 hypothetical protein LNKW23_31660 [Limibaculum sp. NKW23]
MRIRNCLAGCLLALLAGTGPGGGQTIELPDLEDDALERSGIANILPALGLFGVTPGARLARLTVDADPLGPIDVDLLRLPLSHEFAPVWRGLRPVVQITFGSFDIDKRAQVAIIPAFPTGFDVSMSGEMVVAGLGVTVPLGSATTLRPMLLGGYARIRSEATTSGPFSGLLLAVVDGILADARLESPVAGASLELRHRAGLGGDVTLDGALGLGVLYAPVTVATARAIDQPIPFPAVSARIEADGPLWTPESGLALRWLGFAGVNYFPALPGDIAGFPAAAELGGGVTLRGRDMPAGLSLRASVILGDRVTGLSLGASLDF